jgi:hypothetical protein
MVWARLPGIEMPAAWLQAGEGCELAPGEAARCVLRCGVQQFASSRVHAITRCRGLKPRCCPNIPARKVPRSIYEGARAIGKTDAYQTSLLSAKKLEMLFGRLNRILNHNRLLLRGPCSACDEFHLAATVQNLRKRRRSPSRSAGTRLFSTIGPEP